MGPTGTVATAQAKEMSVRCPKSIPDPPTIRPTGLDTTHSESSSTTAGIATTAVIWYNLIILQNHEE
jgi:hypothetical protein